MKVNEKHLKAIVWIIEKVGISLIFCGFLAYLLVVKFDALENRMKRCSRNQMAMMKKLHVEMTSGTDKDQ